MTGVVSNTGPILHLLESDSLRVLGLVGPVHVPVVVAEQLSQLAPQWRSGRPAWVHVETLSASYREEAAAWEESRVLHAGEAQALALARQMDADWFLTDDAGARLAAEAVGIEVHGCLGVVLWAAARGRLPGTDAEAALEGLFRSSLWLSEKVINRAREALASILSRPRRGH